MNIFFTFIDFFQSHSDFSALRHLVLATHMQDLKEVTHARHYETFRREKLGSMVEQEVGCWNIKKIFFSPVSGGILGPEQ